MAIGNRVILTVAAGVAKAKADVVLISGHDFFRGPRLDPAVALRDE